MFLFGHMFAVLLGHKFVLWILNISALSPLLGTAIGNFFICRENIFKIFEFKGIRCFLLFMLMSDYI